ncbi:MULTISPECIES: CGNR zinc finger domain-containing protein [Amycolatopsis]|uniref:Conserved protein containing a Zn-ribbon-like motif, possibly RNA-binding n=2 Tax=Amycolatopsis TaxID=1813 RepID=A0A1I3VM01_9PSEU|nr:ABATE domain-containing protein [Amycolatopsis sacchari]SFJ96013.1 Conserved protein containing a Zn-ribbon-like motif, possibly RNA-binding [Amycolatopsis sacchari]
MTFVFVSGHVALDFAGTLKWRRSEPEETLSGPRELARWFVAAGVLTEPPPVAAGDLPRALTLREAIYSLTTATRTGAPWPGDSIAALNAAAAGEVPVPVLGEGAVSRTGPAAAGLTALAHAAIDLLTGPDAELLKECARDECTRVFVDRSRGRRRTWCGMDECGNRVKAAAYRARKRTA